jgi:ParB family chromosome partitioning protein
MTNGELRSVDLKKIQPNRLNPRLEFGKQALDELADSIKGVGLLEPVIVRPTGDDSYEVVVGERRYRAALQAGIDAVPAIVRDYTDREVLEVNLIENIQREDLSVVEKARVCQRLREQFPDSYSSWNDIAGRVGVGVETIKSWVRTLGLPEPIQTLIGPRDTRHTAPGKIDYQTALHIVERVKEPERQVEIAQQFAQRHVPQRTARQVLQQIAREPDKPVQQVVREVVAESPVYLPFSKVHADAIVQGVKTQTSRKAKDPRLAPGTVVRAQVTHFADLEVLDVYRKRLADFDDDDAKREGGYTLDEFQQVWRHLHGSWNPDEIVYVVNFRLARVVGEGDPA